MPACVAVARSFRGNITQTEFDDLANVRANAMIQSVAAAKAVLIMRFGVASHTHTQPEQLPQQHRNAPLVPSWPPCLAMAATHE